MAHSPKVLLFILVLLLAGGCQPKNAPQGPDINRLVATGMLGTRQAWAVGTIVSATNAALAARAVTTAPPLEATPSPAPLPTAEDPCSSKGRGKLSYSDQDGGYCLFYPDDFFVNKPNASTVEFLGPALDKSPEPLRAYISIAKKDLVKSRTLDEIAMSVWKDARGGYRISNIRLGSQDALMADDLQMGDTGWKIRQVLFTHNGSVYLITLSPVDEKEPFSQARPDIDRFWEMASRTFVFRK